MPAALGLADGALLAADENDSAGPLAAALTALARASSTTSSSSGAAPTSTAVAVPSLEERLRKVDEAAAGALAERAPPPAHQLQEHMLRYQRETDEKAAKQLQAEVRRIREVESGRIRQEERSKARAEVEKVLHEQQTWQAKQLASMRRREAEASRRSARRRPRLRRAVMSIGSVCYRRWRA